MNEKDLKKSNRIPEKIKKTIKQTIDSPILSTSKSPTNGHHKDKMFTSKPDKNGDYSHNRVSFSFQPTTEYLQHFRNVGLTKLGAASSLKSKDAMYQRANLPRSQSVITCHQNLSETPEFSSKIDEVNESNLENKESSETISHRYSQHYAKFDSDSSNTTVEESQTTSFKEKDSIKSKNYKKLKSALNVPKNISKSVEMISKKSTDSKKLDPKKNLDKINEYFTSNTQLTNSKSNKKMDSTCEKPTFIKNIKIIKPIPTTPITKSETITKKPDDKDDKKKLPTDIKIPIIKKKNQQKDKNIKFSTKDDFPDIDDSDINEEEEEQIDRVESTKEKIDEFDVNETDEYEEDDTDDEARNQPSYDYYKTYNSDKNNYHYDTNLYARQSEIYNSYRSHPSPAFFQPGFYPRSNATSVQQQPDLIQSSNSQNVFSQQQQQQQQHHHHHMQYHTHQPYFSKQSSYYGSWYGSTPSLRVPVRSQNRQSSYFN